MIKNLKNNENLCVFYLFVLLKYLFFTISYFDANFIASSILVYMVAYLSNLKNNLAQENIDIIKFACHTIFISLCISIVSSICSSIYGSIFYFGFVNSTILLYISFAIVCSETLFSLLNKMKQYICNFYYGNLLVGFIEYIYTEYISTGACSKYITNMVKNLFFYYVWPFIKFLFNILLSINNELANNRKSKLFGTKINKNYSNGKNYLAAKYIENTFTKPLQDLQQSYSSIVYNKNNYLNQDMNMNMNLLSNNLVNKSTDLDDLDDDDDDDLSHVPEVGKEQIEQAIKLENELAAENKPTEENKPIDENKLNASGNREACKKAIADKRAGRLKGNNVKNNKKAVNNDMSEIMNMPGMNELFGKIMTDNNLQKMMNQIPSEQLKKGAPKVNPNQMKKLMQSLNMK